MKKLALLYFFLCCDLLLAQTDTSLTFSEIMFRPEGQDNEFVEIYNLSDSDTIDLEGYLFSYYTSSPDMIIGHENGTLLPPHSFAVILEGDHDFLDGIYNQLIPRDALVLKLDNNAFGSSGMSNSSDRPIALISPGGDTVDTYNYSADNSAGVSDEKVFMSRDNSSGNWFNSLINHGTPGASNSVTPKKYDLAVTGVELDPPINFEGESSRISANIINLGTLGADDYSIYIFDDTNADSSGQDEELLFYDNLYNLSAGDSVYVGFNFAELELRAYHILFTIEFDSDENHANNSIYYSFKPNPEPNKFNDIVINEIMHSPASGEPEWLELSNNTAADINIKDWRIKDRSTSALLTDEPVHINPNSYLVLSEDESIHDYFNVDSTVLVISNLPSLNNSGDDLILLDSLNRIIDSVSYKSTWGGKSGISLERLSPLESSNDSTNWMSAVTIERATPGKINSITQKEYDLKITSIIIDPEVPIEGENFQILTTIHNTGKLTTGNFAVNYYHDLNKDSLEQQSELVLSDSYSNLVNGDSVLSAYSISDAELGEYDFIVKVEFSLDDFVEDNTGIISFQVNERPADFNDIVINEIMYKPDGDEPEWIELYNNSQTRWDIGKWTISDRSSQVELSDDSLILKPESYLVLSTDETILNYYRIPSAVQFINLPSLNNSGDDLKLGDNLGRIIDSVNYKSSWGGNTSGLSLERILPAGSGIDSTNWGSSDTTGATPGRLNSITPREFDLALTGFRTLDEFAIVGKSLRVNAVVKNIGLNDVDFASLNLYRINTNDTLFVLEIDLGVIAPEDSAGVTLSIDEFNEDYNYFIASVKTERDDRPGNNTKELLFTGIKIIEAPGDIVVNEIMCAPSTDEPEWIEIYNRSDKTINLEQYKIADESDTAVVIDAALNLLSDSYFVFAKDSSILDRYEISNYAIANFPSLNNRGDNVVLLNYINDEIDSISFSSSWGGNNGISLERIDPYGSSNDSTNWASANVDSGGTPGIINSISRKDFDIAVDSILFEPEFPTAGEMVSISALVKNVGKQDITGSIALFENVSYDSIAAETPFIEYIDNILLDLGESQVINFAYVLNSIINPTRYLVIANTDGDTNFDNNHVSRIISPGYTAASIVINEIHYNPSDGEPEWFELLNISNIPINLQNWLVSDVFTTPTQICITTDEQYIQPTEFVVVAKDSAIFEYHSDIPCPVITTNFPNLNNQIDGLVIKDAIGNVLDSVIYKSTYSSNKGYSLERISAHVSGLDSTNWKSSVDNEKSTPGRTNSVVPRNFDLKAIEILTEPEFPIINDKVFPALKIVNNGINTASDFSVKFYYAPKLDPISLSEIKGMTLLPNDSLTVASTSSFLIEKGTSIYAEIIYSSDEYKRNNTIVDTISPGFREKTVLITEFMSQPEAGNSEWIELLNNSNDSINISAWEISDVLSTPTKAEISPHNIYIDPGEYFIVTPDTSGIEWLPEVKLFEANFGVLGNTEDGIIIYDFRGAILDSLFYDRTWNIPKGKSMERISATEPTGNPLNWIPSLAQTGSTPGYQNSIRNAQSYSRNSVVVNEILYEPEADYCEFIEFYNISDEIVNLGDWQLIDETGNTNQIASINIDLKPGEYYLLAADSSLMYNYNLDKSNSVLHILNKSDLGLSNSGEELLVTDIFGNVIDSVKYNSTWHNKNISSTRNRSLERINPALSANDRMNWSTSVDPFGATPGIENSIYTSVQVMKSGIDVSPNPFSPDNDGFEDFTIINYNLKSATNQIRIKIFDDHGRKVRTLVNNMATSSNGSVVFDGLDDNGRALRIGMYIVFLEAVGNNTNVLETHKKVIVVARKF